MHAGKKNLYTISSTEIALLCDFFISYVHSELLLHFVQVSLFFMTFFGAFFFIYLFTYAFFVYLQHQINTYKQKKTKVKSIFLFLF